MRVSVIEILFSSRSIGIRLTAIEASMMAAVSRPENDPVSSGEFPTKETVPVVPASAISNPPQPPTLPRQDRKRAGQGKRVSLRVDPGGRRIIKKKKTQIT